MVFAAYKMQEEEGIDESNYFLRLREVLGLSQHRGRPDGMPAGAEESLWKSWNSYLVDSGFQPTAERGAGPQTYLRYVFSQAILRESDKHFLGQRFHEAHLPLHFDCDQLGFWLSRQTINRRHLFEGLHHSDPARKWEFYRDAHSIYETGNWTGGSSINLSETRSRLRSIECGLYRTVDLRGDVQYLLFPKQPTRARSAKLGVIPPSEVLPKYLRPIRAGFFTPLWPQFPFVDDAIECEVVGDPGIRKMLFPRRDFWVLSRDPENPLGVWATWKPYLDLGESLLVLGRKGAIDVEMSRFREAKLLEWTDRVEHEEWIEYQGCMILSYDWGGFIANPDCRALGDALAPRAMAGVSLVGGLRDTNQNSWLEGFPPTIKIYGFERQFEITVTSARGKEVLREDAPRQQEVAVVRDLEPETYEIEASWNGRRVAARTFRIIPWDDILAHPEPENITNSSPAATAGLALRGPWIVRAVKSERSALA